MCYFGVQSRKILVGFRCQGFLEGTRGQMILYYFHNEKREDERARSGGFRGFS